MKSGCLKFVLLTLVVVAALSGCASPTSLRCGVDGDSSFVELYNLKEGFSQNTREYSDLCGFAYDKEEN